MQDVQYVDFEHYEEYKVFTIDELKETAKRWEHLAPSFYEWRRAGVHTVIVLVTVAYSPFHSQQYSCFTENEPINRLRWYGHVLRKEDRDWVRKCMEYEVGGGQEVEQRGLGQRLCKKTVRHVSWTGRMLWIAVDGGS